MRSLPPRPPPQNSRSRPSDSTPLTSTPGGIASRARTCDRLERRRCAAQQTSSTDLPGISVFYKQGNDVFHTYSCFSRGIDMMNTAYQYLDLVPKGRDEAAPASPMSWLRRRDEYGA